MKKYTVWMVLGVVTYGYSISALVRRKTYPLNDFTRTEYKQECENVFNYLFTLEEERSRLSFENSELKQETFFMTKKEREVCELNKELRADIARFKTIITRLKSDKERVEQELKVEQKANQYFKNQAKDAFSNWLYAQQIEDREKKLVKHFAEMQRIKKLKQEMFFQWKKKYLKKSHL